MLVGSSERLENTTNNRGPNRLPGLNLAHMSRSSGPLSYGFQSLEGSMNAEDIQEESPTQGASLKSEIQDSSSEAVIETSEKSQLTDNLPQENKIKNNSARSKFIIILF